MAPRVRIDVPWNLSIEPSGTIGDGAYILNLNRVTIGAGATVAQEVFLCTGTHKLDDPNLPLQTAPIVVGSQAFLGARSLILPGVTIGPGAVIGAGAVVSRDAEPWSIYVGNPAKKVGSRQLSAQS